MLDKIGSVGQGQQLVFKQPQEKTDTIKEGNNDEIKHGNQSSREDMEKVINGINAFLRPANSHLKFEFHDELREYYVSIVDDVTQEVIKEIPPKKLLDMYASMMSEVLGIIVDKKI